MALVLGQFVLDCMFSVKYTSSFKTMQLWKILNLGMTLLYVGCILAWGTRTTVHLSLLL